jgi:hypothetical protein
MSYVYGVPDTARPHFAERLSLRRPTLSRHPFSDNSGFLAVCLRMALDASLRQTARPWPLWGGFKKSRSRHFAADLCF